MGKIEAELTSKEILALTMAQIKFDILLWGEKNKCRVKFPRYN